MIAASPPPPSQFKPSEEMRALLNNPYVTEADADKFGDELSTTTKLVFQTAHKMEYDQLLQRDMVVAQINDLLKLVTTAQDNLKKARQNPSDLILPDTIIGNAKGIARKLIPQIDPKQNLKIDFDVLPQIHTNFTW